MEVAYWAPGFVPLVNDSELVGAVVSLTADQTPTTCPLRFGAVCVQLIVVDPGEATVFVLIPSSTWEAAPSVKSPVCPDPGERSPL